MRHAPESITAPPIPPTRLRSPLPAPGALGGTGGRWSKGVGLSNPWMFPPPRLTWDGPVWPSREWERPR